ncbi:phosphotransferase enzyme family protein [Poseidonocella sp. HB161398]|uniref:phosphotransferase enzyme family protein n=1 Tax=Poseidonocella sp. HB161398 TaxID=2320855 RepID=UPI001108BCE3|nr:phosphotransferase [Poseidonocella sp. HB161398]
MAGLYGEEFVSALERGLRTALPQWGLAEDCPLRLMALSENATFLAEPPDAAPRVFRVHRPGYHDRAEIASELDWIAALAEAGTARVPELLPCRDGARIGGFAHEDGTRHVVAFAFVPGEEPDPEGDLAAGFRQLGAISADLHAQAAAWTPPAGFRRKTWDWEAAFGARPLWGDWRAAPGLDAAGRALLDRLAARLKERCEAYGRGPDRFGLIHADLRLANLLDGPAGLSVIDFDDCGFSWFAYDFAAAASFLEARPVMPELLAAWVAGYRSRAELAAEHVAMIPDLVLFRRLLLTAWIGSHGETETADWAGQERYTAGTLELAERYLCDGAAHLLAGPGPGARPAAHWPGGGVPR